MWPRTSFRAWPGPKGNKGGGGFQNGAYPLQWPNGKRALRVGWCQRLRSQGEPHFLPASLKGVQRSACGLWGCRVGHDWVTDNNRLCVSFRCRVYFPQPSGFPLSEPFWPSKPKCWGLIFPKLGPQLQGLVSLLLGENLLLQIAPLPSLYLVLNSAVSLPPSTHPVLTSYCWLWNIFSADLPVFLVNSCSVC